MIFQNIVSLNLATNEDELFEEGFNEIDEDDILRLSEKLSLSPELLIGLNEEESILADMN